MYSGISSNNFASEWRKKCTWQWKTERVMLHHLNNHSTIYTSGCNSSNRMVVSGTAQIIAAVSEVSRLWEFSYTLQSDLSIYWEVCRVMELTKTATVIGSFWLLECQLWEVQSVLWSACIFPAVMVWGTKTMSKKSMTTDTILYNTILENTPIMWTIIPMYHRNLYDFNNKRLKKKIKYTN